MRNRVFVVLAVTVSPYIVSAANLSLPNYNNVHIKNTVLTSQQDTLARDLSDLEEALADSVVNQQDGGISYIEPKPKDFNALRFVLDRRHRYSGDKFVNKGFWDHTYLEFGAGISRFLKPSNFRYSPTTNLHLEFGKDLSPMSSVRVGVEGAWGFTKLSPNISSLTTYRAIGGHIDYLFNFTNYMLGYRPERPLTVSGVVGLGLQNASLAATDNSDIGLYTTNSGLSFNTRLGLQFRIATSPHASMAIEPYVKLGSTKQDLVVADKFNSLDFAYGVNLAYRWYFYPEISKSQNAGLFMTEFEENQRLFQEQYAKKHWRRPMFFEYSIGPAFFNRTKLSLGSSAGYTGNAYFGWWLSPVLGIRTGLHIANADWADNSKLTEPFKTKSFLGTRGIVLDALFNPFGFTRHYNWDAPVGMNLLAGYENGRIRLVNEGHYGYKTGSYVGYRLGAQLWMKLTNDLRLNVEPTYSFFEQYTGDDRRRRYDEFATKLGLTLLFRDKASREKFQLDSIEGKRLSQMHGFFFGGGAGWNTTVHTWRYVNGNTSFLKNGLLFGGYNFNQYHGVRLSGEYVADNVWQLDPSGTKLNKLDFSNTLLSLDYQLNLSNAVGGYHPFRRWNAYVYAGPTLVLGDGGADFALNFGGMLSYHITPNLSLFYNHTIYRMSKNRYNIDQVYHRRGTFVNALNVGLLYNVNSTFKQMALALRKATTTDYSQHPLSFEYSVGPALYNNVDLSFGNTIGYTANANIGWWLNSAIGVRGGIHITNADWRRTESRQATNLLGFTAGTLDLMFNPLGFTKKYNWNKPLGVNLFGGFGLGKIRFVTEAPYQAYEGTFNEYRMGAQLWVKLANDLRLNFEPTYSIMGNFSGNKVKDHVDELGLKLGIAMLLRDRSKDKVNDAALSDTTKVYNPSGFFFGGGLGWNSTVHTWRYTGKSDGGLLKNGTIFGGYNINEYHGVRLSGEYLADKIWIDLGAGNFEEEKFKNTAVSLDYQFNILNAITGVNPARRWNASVYLGPSLILGDKGTELAFNAGGILSYSLTPNLSLFYSHTVYRMSKDRYRSAQVYRTPGTFVNSLNFGLLYNANYSFKQFRNDIRTDYSRQPLSFEYSVGPALYNNVDLSMGNTIGYTANANIGWWLNSAIGARLGLHITNADWRRNEVRNTTNLLGFTSTTLDLMFNPLGIRKVYDWNQPVGFNVFAGFGLGKIRFVTEAPYKAYEGTFNEYRMGAQFWVKLANDLRLNFEPTYSIMSNFSGDKVKNHVDELGLKLGIAMLLRDRSQDKNGKANATEVSDKEYNPSGFFFGGGLGWNSTVHTWRYTGKSDGGLLKNGTIFGGYNINEYHGVRLSGEYLADKIWIDLGAGNFEEEKFKNTAVSLDYQFNILNAITGVNPARRWNASVYLGPSLILGDKGTELAFNAGGILSYSLTPNLSLFYSHTVYRMSKDRYRSAQVYRTPGTFVNSLNFGLIYNTNYSFKQFKKLTACDYSNRPFFFEYSVGPAFYNKVDLSMGNTLGYTANANIGWWFNSALALRGGIHITNADWKKNETRGVTNLLGFSAGTLDVMFNPLGITRMYNWHAPAGVNLFAGIGSGKIRFVTDAPYKAYEGTFTEYRLGVQFWLRLADNFRLNFEPTYSLLGNFSGDKVKKNVDELALKLGVTMMLKGGAENKKETSGEEYNTGNGFFIGAGGGWNTTVHTWRYTDKSMGFLKNGTAFVGYNLNEYHGVRLIGEYLTDHVWDDWGNNYFYKREFKNTLVSLDYQFNILNALAGVNPTRRWNASLFVGPSVALGDKGTAFAFNFGGIFSYNVTRNLALFYSHTIYRMDKDRYYSAQVYRTPGSIVNSLNIGVQYNFNRTIIKTKKKQ